MSLIEELAAILVWLMLMVLLAYVSDPTQDYRVLCETDTECYEECLSKLPPNMPESECEI